jgi:uncharacterized membrane protein
VRWTILALAILFLAIFALSLNATHYGAVVLIGPIPIAVASDVAIAAFLILLTFAILVLLLLFSFLSKFPEAEEVKIEPKTEKKFGGIVLIGPLPIIFGEARMAIIASILAIILMILAFVLFLGWLG